MSSEDSQMRLQSRLKPCRILAEACRQRRDRGAGPRGGKQLEQHAADAAVLVALRLCDERLVPQGTRDERPRDVEHDEPPNEVRTAVTTPRTKGGHQVIVVAVDEQAESP